MQSDRRRAGTPPSRLPPSGLDVADLDRPIREVLPELARGIAALARLGIVTPRQALFHLPFRYDDFSALRPPAPRRGADLRRQGRAPRLAAAVRRPGLLAGGSRFGAYRARGARLPPCWRDRKSTRLNSSHGYISYAVFCF